jgi:hypothetical protein
MKGYIQWVGGALLFALAIIQISTCNHYKHESEEQSSLITAYQDTVKHYKDEDGKNSAQIAVLQGSKENLLHIIGKSDAQLTKLLKKGASSGTAFQQTTKFDTVVVVKRDTVNGKVAYENTIVNNWMRLHVGLKDDSLTTSIETRDSLSVSFQRVGQGFLRPKKSVVIVRNSNPYVKTTGLRAFDIPQKKSNLKFWFGVGIGAGAGYLLFK